MIRSFRKFFEFAGRQSRNWYLGLFYEIIRCILEALQFAALLVVLDGLVRDNITAQTALLAFGIMLVVDHGRIVQHGTHDQLIQQKGIYADFILNRKAAIDWKINA